MSAFPDYYTLLGVTPSATQDQIRQAYKRESLKTHPDRLVNARPEERRRATEKFQAIADAYYVLSDTKRRRDYDLQYESRSFNERTPDPDASANFFENFTNMFGAGSSNTRPEPQARPDAEGTFTDVFEELLRPEVERRVPWWSYLGALCGAGVGFIIANFPGLIAGLIAGNRLGAIRDAKGKSVAVVFTNLGGEQKAQILRALAMKVLGSTFTY